ncbi:MAG: hypothetical protein ACOYD7_02835 [Raoultibacter sp.]|jgi:hypothetical protein
MCAKKSGMEPITPIGIAAAIIFGGMGIMQLNDPNSNILVALFNLLIAMVSIFVALWPLVKANRKR